MFWDWQCGIMENYLVLGGKRREGKCPTSLQPSSMNVEVLFYFSKSVFDYVTTHLIYV